MPTPPPILWVCAFHPFYSQNFSIIYGKVNGKKKSVIDLWGKNKKAIWRVWLRVQ